MRIRRTVKDHYLGIPLKYAGESEIITDRDRMERIVSGTTLGQPLKEERISHIEKARLIVDRFLKDGAPLETFYAKYELLEA